MYTSSCDVNGRTAVSSYADARLESQYAHTSQPKAVAAAAHKLARLIYAMLTKGEEYTGQGQAYYEERYRQRVIANLNRRAQQLGLQVVPAVPPTSA